MKIEKKDLLVVYKNSFNSLPLRNFNSVEMDLLFSLMSQLRDKGEDKLIFTFDELKKLSKYNKETAIISFVKDLEKTYTKLTKLNVRFEDDKEIRLFVFFIDYVINKEEQTIRVGVHPEFKNLINELTGNFTKFELNEFTSLKSSYSKTMYRLLKQFRTTGYAVFDINNFRYLLDIPDSYKMGNIDQQILKPIKKELPQYFKNLKINKIKGKGKYKRNIVKIEVLFNPQNDVENGYKVFRDSDGLYYTKHLYDFNVEEVRKTYPD